MPTFGEFRPVRVIAETAGVTVSLARGPKKSEAIVKHIADDLVLDPSLAEGRGRVIRDRAAVQQRASEAKPSRWAAVLAAGGSGTDAYSVIEWFARSGDTLVNAGATLDARSISGFMIAAIDAVMESREAIGRAHGNLKPSNILIDDRADIASARVVLTDPASDAELDASRADRDDAVAVASLLYRLVTGGDERVPRMRTLQPQPEWDRFGDAAEGIRDRCGEILDEVGDATDLGGLREALGKVLRRVRSRRRLKVGAALVASLVLAAGGVGVYTVAFQPEAPQFIVARASGETDEQYWNAACEAADRWIGDFLESNDIRPVYMGFAKRSRIDEAFAEEYYAALDDIRDELTDARNSIQPRAENASAIIGDQALIQRFVTFLPPEDRRTQFILFKRAALFQRYFVPDRIVAPTPEPDPASAVASSEAEPVAEQVAQVGRWPVADEVAALAAELDALGFPEAGAVARESLRPIVDVFDGKRTGETGSFNAAVAASIANLENLREFRDLIDGVLARAQGADAALAAVSGAEGATDLFERATSAAVRPAAGADASDAIRSMAGDAAVLDALSRRMAAVQSGVVVEAVAGIGVVGELIDRASSDVRDVEALERLVAELESDQYRRLDGAANPTLAGSWERLVEQVGEQQGEIALATADYQQALAEGDDEAQEKLDLASNLDAEVEALLGRIDEAQSIEFWPTVARTAEIVQRVAEIEASVGSVQAQLAGLGCNDPDAVIDETLGAMNAIASVNPALSAAAIEAIRTLESERARMNDRDLCGDLSKLAKAFQTAVDSFGSIAPDFAGTPAPQAQALAAAIERERERVIDGVIASGVLTSPPRFDRTFEARAVDAAAALEAWSSLVAAGASDAQLLRASFDRWRTFDDDGFQTSENVGDVLRRLRLTVEEASAREGDVLLAAFGELALDRASELERLAGGAAQSDRIALLAAAPSSDLRVEHLVAFRAVAEARLADPDAWPADPGELGVAMDAATTLLDRLSPEERPNTLPDQAEFERRIVDDEIRPNANALWNRVARRVFEAGGAPAPDVRTALFDRLEPESALGVSIASVGDDGGDWLRYNHRLWRLETRLSDPALRQRNREVDDEVIGLATEFLADADVELYAGGSSTPTMVEALLERLEEEGRGPDFRELGPGRVGWEVVEESPDGGEVLYRHPANSEWTMLFRRVETDGPEGARLNSYVAERELSAEQASRWVKPPADHATHDAVVQMLGAIVGEYERGVAENDSRRGIRTWNWRRSASTPGKMVPILPGAGDPNDGQRNMRSSGSRGWFRFDAIFNGMNLDGKPYYAEGIEAKRPDGTMPLNQVTPYSVVAIASSLGCRVPTVDEWLSAYSQLGALAGHPTMWNRRGENWAAQVAWVRENNLQRWPSAGVFWPTNDVLRVPPLNSDDSFVRPINKDDDLLWFLKTDDWVALDVDEADAPIFRHLIGNVAEFVIAGDAPTPTDLTSVNDSSVVAEVELIGDRWRVIGASALSHPAIEPATPYGLNRELAPALRDARFSDVGIRLAFTAQPVRPYTVVRLQECIDDAGWRSPPGG